GGFASARVGFLSGLCALPCSGRTLSLGGAGAALPNPKPALSGLCALPFSGRTLSVESQPRAGPLAGPAVFYLRWFYLRQGGGGVAAQLGGRRGARGRRKVRGGLSGLCALAFSGRTLSVESQPRAGPLAGP